MSAAMTKTKTPGIYRRGSRYVVTFRDRHGTPHKQSAATLAEARNLKATLTADIRRGDYRPASRIGFADYAHEWVSSYQGRTSRGIRPETLKDYQADLERDAIPFFGRLELAAIEPRDIKAYAAQLAGRGLSPGSIRNTLAPVRLLLATAYEDGIIRANPAAGLRLNQPQQAKGAEPKRKALSEHELTLVLTAVPAEWRLFFELLAHTGLRIGEAVALKWDDIDLGNRRLNVQRRRYRGRIDTPKMEPSFRVKPEPPAGFEAPADVQEIVALSEAIRANQDQLPAGDRIFIGGELVLTSLQANVINIAKIHRFGDFGETWLTMNERLNQ